MSGDVPTVSPQRPHPRCPPPGLALMPSRRGRARAGGGGGGTGALRGAAGEPPLSPALRCTKSSSPSTLST